MQDIKIDWRAGSTAKVEFVADLDAPVGTTVWDDRNRPFRPAYLAVKFTRGMEPGSLWGSLAGPVVYGPAILVSGELGRSTREVCYRPWGDGHAPGWVTDAVRTRLRLLNDLFGKES